MARLFAAIRLDDAARRFAVELSEALARAGLAARFERPEKLHVTLAFFGSVPGDRVATYAAALEGTAAGCAPFAILLDRLGGFPDERRPRLVWLGCSAPQPGYVALAVRLHQAFEAVGWHASDQDIVPHVTLCRAKHALRGIPDVTMGSVEVVVKEIVLYESLPDGTTSRYEVRAVAPLRGSRD